MLEARAQLAIAQGNIFPQSQQAFGAYQRIAASQNYAGMPGFSNQFFNQWNFGFNLSWELDLWGRLRRAIEAADDTLEASCAITTTCWSRCWATWPQITSRFAPFNNGSNWSAPTSICSEKFCSSPTGAMKPAAPERWTPTRPAAIWTKPKPRFRN